MHFPSSLISTSIMNRKDKTASFLTSASESQVSAWSFIHWRIWFDWKYTHSYQIGQIELTAVRRLLGRCIYRKRIDTFSAETRVRIYSVFFFLSGRGWISRVFQSNRNRSSFTKWKKDDQLVGGHFYHRSVVFKENERSKLVHKREERERRNTHFLSLCVHQFDESIGRNEWKEIFYKLFDWFRYRSTICSRRRRIRKIDAFSFEDSCWLRRASWKSIVTFPEASFSNRSSSCGWIPNWFFSGKDR